MKILQNGRSGFRQKAGQFGLPDKCGGLPTRRYNGSVIFKGIILLAWLAMTALADENWQSALNKMPMVANVVELNRTNCVSLLLNSFQSNGVVKALIFMPGATDEFYFFSRARATLTNSNPTLLDAIIALTNQTYIQADFRPPLLLLHTTEDALDGF